VSRWPGAGQPATTASGAGAGTWWALKQPIRFLGAVPDTASEASHSLEYNNACVWCWVVYRLLTLARAEHWWGRNEDGASPAPSLAVPLVCGANGAGAVVDVVTGHLLTEGTMTKRYSSLSAPALSFRWKLTLFPDDASLIQ
jgi:hypothetical protein